MEVILTEIREMLAVELVLSFLFFFGFCVVCFFLCRLLLAVAKFFEFKSRLLRHDLAVDNYRDEE